MSNQELKEIIYKKSFIKEIVINREELQNRIKELGEKITRDYQNENEIIIICVLRGAVMFFTDIIKYINLPIILDFISVSSYGKSKKSSGIVRIIKDIKENIENKNVLIIEDIVDTGLTLINLKKTLETRNPKSLKVCCLINKPSQRLVPLEIDYVGFTIEDKFVVGYGLDYSEFFRNYDFIFVPNEEVLNKAGLYLDED
ncbi:MAG TPA: hypoxanthine phosphoribosyltransferase [bacterium]|nr:hypoxanthine phosphoribosyltransferase [bacterium]HOL47362.1 hypoxanthine phosphoribosyltransferase [bacterium]HPQ18905.1 hypoxanthine phosphoribosyltransferase [bacterium]